MEPFATSHIWVHTSVYVDELPQVPKNDSNQCLEFVTRDNGDFDVDLGQGVEKTNERGFENKKYNNHKECCVI